MQVNRIAPTPGFGRIWRSNGEFNKTQEKLFQDISSMLNIIAPEIHPTKSPVDVLEGNGYDVYISTGFQNDAVLVDLIRNTNPYSPDTSYSYRVGRYTENEPFKIKDLEQVKRDSNACKALLIFLPIFIVTGIFANIAKQRSLENSDLPKIEQAGKVFTDSINFVKNDTIKLVKQFVK